MLLEDETMRPSYEDLVSLLKPYENDIINLRPINQVKPLIVSIQA